jgi:peptidoglycan/LPS O-acetylase OafA/YrhL
MDPLIHAYQGFADSRWGAPALIGLRIVLIVAAAWLLIALLQRLVREARIRIRRTRPASTPCAVPRRSDASCATSSPWWSAPWR